MKVAKKIKNPLKGKVFFKEEGIEIERYATINESRLNPPVSPREWFYLLINAHEGELPAWATEWKKNMIGSSVTQWRTKNSLTKKGYLLK